MVRKLLLSASFAFVLACNSGGRQPWPDGVIPFTIIGFDGQETADILHGMALWEMATGQAVKFLPENMNNNETKTLLIIKSDVDNSCVIGAGYDPDGNNAVILNKTDSYQVCHELGHIIGLQHEIQRPDRDAYITVNILSNIPLLYLHQIVYTKFKFYDYSKYPFDYKSVMMYSEYLVSGVIIDGHGHELSGETPTWIDAWKVRDIYANARDW